MSTRQLQGTFTRYLAQRLIAEKEYAAKMVPEAAPLAAACDLLLTRMDGVTMTILCLVDRESNPSKTFALSPEQVREIGAKCLKYAGKVNNAQMPIVIQIAEIGSVQPDQRDLGRLRPYQRAKLSSKAVIVAMALDTGARTLWSNGLLRGFPHRHGFIGKCLREWRGQDVQVAAPQPIVFGPKRLPIVTYALLAVLTAVFIAEVRFGARAGGSLLAPGTAALVALGALNKHLVLQSGEWYRMLSAVMLHANVLHLALNGICLVVVGSILEPLIGRLWLAAVFIIGGLCGSGVSMALNDGGVISVGASGAIMALFAAAYVCTFRLPLARGRTPLQMRIVSFMVPALIPLATHRTGAHIDFGAHLGGAVGGLILGMVLLKNWRRSSPVPGLRTVAAALALTGWAATAMAIVPVARNFTRYGALMAMIPDAKMPKTDADAAARSAELVARYPEDPRSHWFRAVALLKSRQPGGAERELRLALAKWGAVSWDLQPGLEYRMRLLLGEVLVAEHRQEEARAVAVPACNAGKANALMPEFSRVGLCD